MYVDNLTIAGILVVSFYALLPLLFGREFLRVEDEEADAGRLHSGPDPEPNPTGAEVLPRDQRSPWAGA
jgi:hypothetical protein